MDERRALAEIEAAFRREDPGLAARLASFTVGPSRKIRTLLAGALLAVIFLVAVVGGGGNRSAACDAVPADLRAAGGQSDESSVQRGDTETTVGETRSDAAQRWAGISCTSRA